MTRRRLANPPSRSQHREVPLMEFNGISGEVVSDCHGRSFLAMTPLPREFQRVVNSTVFKLTGLFHLFFVSLVVITFNMTKVNIGETEYPNLEKCAEQFHRISDHVPIVLYDYILHPDGSSQFQYVSSSCEEILELTEEEMLNDSMSFWSRVHQDDIEALQSEDERTTLENSFFKSEFRYITKSGKTKWLQAASNPSKLLYGNTSLFSGYCLDITEKKNLESHLKNELETKDKFLSILSHDIRTPLGSLMVFAELLYEKLDNQDYTDLLEYASIVKNTSE
ncbi:PAS domain S-box protein [uncultured Draconibacterium sp.]|uniref:PAS domain S-box protein n=1 Tax=uncultured Draconibacterium sp. TaxID=1573823 RepID=UPI0029C7A182|nr:PAS domain S-box protein [uncultured Draconibacterium sp.]